MRLFRQLLSPLRNSRFVENFPAISRFFPVEIKFPANSRFSRSLDTLQVFLRFLTKVSLLCGDMAINGSAVEAKENGSTLHWPGGAFSSLSSSPLTPPRTLRGCAAPRARGPGSAACGSMGIGGPWAACGSCWACICCCNKGAHTRWDARLYRLPHLFLLGVFTDQ